MKRIIAIALTLLAVFLAFYLIKDFFIHKEAELDYDTFISAKSIYPDWIENRASQQVQESKNFEVFHGFSFTNKQEKSGIDFRHLINPNGGKDHIPAHYDHGNGVTIADVDNDGDLDIYFVSLVGSGSLWSNLGSGKFENITKGSGLEITGTKTCISASFADIDNDGDADLYVSTIREGNFLFRNDGRGVFSDISEEANVNFHGHSSGIVFFDYDLDGLLDIFLTNVGIYTSAEKEDFIIDGNTYSYYPGLKDAFAGHLKPERFESSKLYHNLGDNKFKEVGGELGITDTGWTGDAALLDGNNDGYLDLYLTNMQGDDYYYENQKGEKFIEKRKEFFPKTPWGAMGVSIFDFDNNGMQDVYITDMHSDMMGGDIPPDFNLEKEKAVVTLPEEYLLTKGQSIFGNAFYKKTTDSQFEEISSNIGAENYWPWGLSNGDLNADGFEDVFIASSMNYPFRYSVNSVMLNEKGNVFRDSEFLLGVEPRDQFSKPWFTLDCSGKDKDHFQCVGKEGEVIIYGSLGTRSSVIFDLDNDGDLDIVTNEFNDVPQVLISNLTDEKPKLTFLKVRLEGVKSNRDGIGSKIILESNGSTYTKVMTGKSGYLSQSSFPLYFGLNEAKTIDRVIVEWPSGIKQTISNPTINSLLVISENETL